jgi:predicted ArsR family transcriptional regulator
MFDENAHAGAVESYGELARYLIAAMETLGKENALQIHEKAFEMQGAGIETMLRSMHPEVNLEELGKMFEETLNSTGFESESFMEDENTVIIRNTRCPRYDSF